MNVVYMCMRVNCAMTLLSVLHVSLLTESSASLILSKTHSSRPLVQVAQDVWESWRSRVVMWALLPRSARLGSSRSYISASKHPFAAKDYHSPARSSKLTWSSEKSLLKNFTKQAEPDAVVVVIGDWEQTNQKIQCLQASVQSEKHQLVDTLGR